MVRLTTNVDSISIELTADADSAAASLEKLAGKLDLIIQSMGKLKTSNLTTFVNDIKTLSSAMQGLSAIKMPDYTRLAKGIEKISGIDAAQITNAGKAMKELVNGLQVLDGVNVSDNATKIGELAKGITQLGYTASTKAIENIPLLAKAMKELINTLSTAPKVSQNVIDLTNALAKLSRTGASSGKAATSLSKSLDTYSKSAKSAKSHSFSLASAIGKMYATYWALFRLFGKLGDAIDISSKLTEVQNVVDVTFGKYSQMVENLASTSIADFGMSELTVKKVASNFQAMGSAMGIARGEMANMSVELTKLTADMASFYNVEQDAVAEDLASIFTGETRPLRDYGLDLTQATLQEWALKQGMDANISSMTQAEKALLRYQYVMANTTDAQGDFARTSDRICVA